MPFFHAEEWHSYVVKITNLMGTLLLHVNHFQLGVFAIFVTMFHQAEGGGEGLAVTFGVVSHACHGVGDGGCFAQVFVTIIETSEFGPLVDEHVHGHDIAGQWVL